jgi:hypothetical protein
MERYLGPAIEGVYHPFDMFFSLAKRITVVSETPRV